MKWLWYLIAVLLVFGGGTYYYDCRIKQVCGKTSSMHVPLPPLNFGWNDASARTEADFAAFKSDLLAKGKPDQALTITGLYFASEKAENAIDLGSLRAQAVANLFAGDLEPERVQTRSRMVDENAPDASSRFAGVQFEWTAIIATNTMPSAPIALGFAANSSEAVIGPGFDALQSALNTPSAQQQLEITGLWFEGESESLGMQRAQAASDLFASWLPKQNALLRTRFSGSDARPVREALMFRWMDAAVQPALENTAGLTVSNTLTVFFDSNSDVVINDALWQSNLAAFVSAATGKKVRVRGHTDSSGRASKNNVLGLKRAAALRAVLVNAGVDENSIELTSSSASQPQSDNDSEQGKALNRRAEASIQ